MAENGSDPSDEPQGASLPHSLDSPPDAAGSHANSADPPVEVVDDSADSPTDSPTDSADLGQAPAIEPSPADAVPTAVEPSAPEPVPAPGRFWSVAGQPTPVPPEADPAAAVKKKRARAPWWELPLLVVIAVIVAMLIKTFLVQPYFIPSASMEKTLHGCSGCSGDRILVNKPIFDLRNPHPGDIIVFKAPPGWDDEPTPSPPSNPILHGIHWAGQLIGLVPPDENDLVKRVIAVGGQTVQCCDTEGRVQVSNNGPSGPWHSLDESYIYQDLPWVATDRPGQSAPIDPLADQRTFGPVTIPKGRLWVMGDHRSVSDDSRYHYTHDFRGDAVGSTVPLSAVIGKAVLIVWPPSRWRTLGTPQTFKQLALAYGGPVAPVLGSVATVVPVWVGRRRRRAGRWGVWRWSGRWRKLRLSGAARGRRRDDP